MRFDELATFFARLEASGRRLGAVQIVADLFDRAAAPELAPIVYLLQGQLRPPYEGVEIGLGEQRRPEPARWRRPNRLGRRRSR